jgi:hypothetical protein
MYLFFRWISRHWYTCQCPTSAPWNDLQLLKQLIAYKAISLTIATGLQHVLSNYFRYLGEMLVGMVLFYSAVCEDSMIAIVEFCAGYYEPLRHLKVYVQTLSLQELIFVAINTKTLFIALVCTRYSCKLPTTASKHMGR